MNYQLQIKLVLRAGGGKTPKKTTTTTEPWKEQQPYLKNVWGAAEDLYGAGPLEYYPGQQVASQAGATLAGQNYMTDYASYLANGGATDNMFGAWNNQLNATDVDNNPYLARAAEGAIRPVANNLLNNVMPQIGSSAQMNGAYGGARQGLLEGQAVGEATRAMLDTTNSMYSNAYQQGMQSQANAIGMAPTVFNAGAMPGEYLNRVGQQQQQYEQMLIDAEKAKWDYQQQAPWLNLQNYNGIVAGGSWGGSQTAPAAQSNPWMGALGGAAAGSAIMPGWGTAAGAAIGYLAS